MPSGRKWWLSSSSPTSVADSSGTGRQPQADRHDAVEPDLRLVDRDRGCGRPCPTATAASKSYSQASSSLTDQVAVELLEVGVDRLGIGTEDQRVGDLRPDDLVAAQPAGERHDHEAVGHDVRAGRAGPRLGGSLGRICGVEVDHVRLGLGGRSRRPRHEPDRPARIRQAPSSSRRTSAGSGCWRAATASARTSVRPPARRWSAPPRGCARRSRRDRCAPAARGGRRRA